DVAIPLVQVSNGISAVKNIDFIKLNLFPEDHFERDDKEDGAEDSFEGEVGQAVGELGADQAAEDEADAHQAGGFEVDVAFLIVGPGGQDADRRDHQRQRRTLRHVLAEPEEDDEDRNQDRAAADADQPAADSGEDSE